MTFHLPLVQCPGSVLFLDDDIDYLDTLGMVIPEHLRVELYSRPSSFIERMREEPARWESDASLQLQMIESWRRGHPLLPQVLHYWASSPERHQLARTCVVDYAMPGTDGLKVLNTLQDWPGARILLTGQADEKIAIQAFNNGLIDYFIPKQSHDITVRLLSALDRLAHQAHPRLDSLWRLGLHSDQQALLRRPSVARALQQFTQQRCIEYVVLGEPFGILGLDTQGHCLWLQLEPTHTRGALTELASTAGLPPDLMRSVQAGQRVPAVELHQQLGLQGPIRSEPAFAIGDDGLLNGAVFALQDSDLPEPIPKCHDPRTGMASRHVQDA